MAELEPEVPELLVSVLIVSHNCVDALRACVQALEQSSERNVIEVLVVDNASRDGCAAMDTEFPGITVLRLPHHLGLTRARNIGIRTAKAPYLLLMTPDVLVEPGTVTALARQLAAESSALAVCPLLVDENGAPVSRAGRLPTPEQAKAAWRNPESLLEKTGDPAGEPRAIELHDGKALLLRKQTLQGINYLDEKYGEAWIDVDLAWQIRRAGRKILLIPAIRARLNTGAELWAPAEPGDRATFDADAASGAARYISKQTGWFSGLLFQIGLALQTFLKILTFSDLSYQSALFSRLASGGRIDGSELRQY